MFSPELLDSIRKVRRSFDIVGVELLDHEKIVLHLVDKLFDTKHTVTIPEINDVFHRLLLDHTLEDAMLLVSEALVGRLHNYNFVQYFVSNGVIICDN